MLTRITGTVDPECLSALVDGEIDEAELTGACEAWRVDGVVRATWHSYQLIGDVLRSDDLASDASHDCSFLTALRGRLAIEPVVLAPPAPAGPKDAVAGRAPFVDESLTTVLAPRAAARRSRPAWAMPSAVAAGFVLVVGTFTVMRSGAPPPDAGTVAVAAVDPGTVTRAALAKTDPLTAGATADGPVLRDARLDRYLDAHKQFAGSSALGAPSAFLRSATVDSSAR